MRTGDGFAASSEILDAYAELMVDMPALLLIAADRSAEVGWAGRLPMRLASRVTGASPACGLTDAALLMTRLWLLNTIIRQPTVRLSQLLGGIDVGPHEVVLRVPSSGFTHHHISHQVDQAEFAAQTARVDMAWAYMGPTTADVSSWLYLRSESEGKLVSIQLQSREQMRLRSLSPASMEPNGRRMFWVRGLQHVLLVVTDHHKVKRQSSWLRLLTLAGPRYDPAIVITPELHRTFYGGCKYLVLSVLAER